MKDKVIFPEKLIKPLFSALKEIISEGKHADKILQQFFTKYTKITFDERSFVSELVYDLLYNWRLLRDSFGEADEFIFDHPFSFLPAYYILKKMEMPEVLYRTNFKHKFFERELAKNLSIRKLKYSYSDELDAFISKDLGEEKWNKIIQDLHQRPKTYIRTNSFKISRDELAASLLSNRIKTKSVKEFDDALEVLSKSSLFMTKEFHAGLFEIQDLASQKVAAFLEIKSGDKVIDACAGTGGKSLHIGSILKNKGKIISLDISAKKLDILKRRASRGGFQNIEAHEISDDILKKFSGTADKLLLDVPCSGTGVFKRNPDGKWHITPENINDLILVQKEILEKYSAMCKPDGIIVYANCSILNCEGELQIQQFIHQHPNWRLIKQKRINPSELNCDGFYMAMLKKG